MSHSTYCLYYNVRLLFHSYLSVIHLFCNKDMNIISNHHIIILYFCFIMSLNMIYCKPLACLTIWYKHCCHYVYDSPECWARWLSMLLEMAENTVSSDFQKIISNSRTHRGQTQLKACPNRQNNCFLNSAIQILKFLIIFTVDEQLLYP